jgi:hypothetical protein
MVNGPEYGRYKRLSKFIKDNKHRTLPETTMQYWQHILMLKYETD